MARTPKLAPRSLARFRFRRSSAQVLLIAVFVPVLLAGPLLGPSAAATGADQARGAASGNVGPIRPKTVSFPLLLSSSSPPVCLETWARAAGLQVRWEPGQQFATVSGRPTEVDRAFDVSIHDYRARNGGRYFAADHRPVVPRHLCGEVAGAGVIRSYRTPNLDDVPSGGLLPQQLVRAYDGLPLTAQGIQGQRQTIVFFEADGFSTKDLNAFDRLLPSGEQSPVNPTVVGGNPGAQSNMPSESTLDIETAHEIAPDAKIVYINLGSSQFSSDTTSQAFIDAFQLADKRWKGAVWSVSLGLCETDGSTWDSSDLLAMANAVGVAEGHGTTMFASSGDAGGLECAPSSGGGQAPQQSWFGVQVPASLPTVTGVGGTSLSTTANGSYVGETSWSEPLLSQGTGGGVSGVFARPSWQTGNGTGTYDPNNARQVPDVSADADSATGNVIVENGQKVTGGGTSLATPIWAAFTALIDQYLTSHGGSLVGFLNPDLYALANGSPPYPPFHDVKVGGNDLYPATPGYDMATGLGSPDVWNLARDLAAKGA